MSEQRLIDANVLRDDWLENGENEYVYDTNSFLSSLDDAPTIDQETLPIVRELREKLELVTKERDAAIKDRAELADFELEVCEQFCFGDRKHNIPPCEWNRFGRCQLREWRGPVAENATTDTLTEKRKDQL